MYVTYSDLFQLLMTLFTFGSMMIALCSSQQKLDTKSQKMYLR